MTHFDFARRRARIGGGFLPPNKLHWNNEHNGLDLREDLGLPPDVPLPHQQAFGLLPNTIVLPLGAVPVAQKYIEHLRGSAKSAWSGLATRIGDTECVLYNDAHAPTRIRATLMEEFFHLWLDHPRSRIRLLALQGRNRTHDSGVELEAYASGAASLVPYRALRAMLEDHASVKMIANHFQVSQELVTFRMKICRQFRRRVQ